MWFKKKQHQQQPFVPLPLDQVLALDAAALKKYQQAHATYVEESLKAMREQEAAQAQAHQEQMAALDRESRERSQHIREETERTLQHIFEQNRQQIAQQQQETTNMMQRAFNNPATFAAFQRALAPQPPAVPQLGNEQIIEGEILSSEEISTAREETND